MSGLRRYIVTLCVVLGGWLSVAAGEPVRIESARFVPDSVLIGDHFDLVMEVVSREGYAVGFPSIANAGEGKIELLEEGGVDTLSVAGGDYRLRKRWRMTSFEPAKYSIDSLGVLYTDGRTVDTLYAPNALELTVQMMPVDTAQKTIYDIKQPLKMPVLFGEVVETGGRVLGVLIALAAVVVAVVFVVRKLRRKGAEAEKPKEPAHIVAIRELESLHNQKLWQNGKVKEYYSRLTEILREYLDGRYGVGAMEMTTDEIVVAMKGLSLTKKQSSLLGELLAESDLVKFAKYIPAEEYHEEAYNTVYYFVEESKEVAEEVVSPEAQNLEGVVAQEKREVADE